MRTPVVVVVVLVSPRRSEATPQGRRRGHDDVLLALNLGAQYLGQVVALAERLQRGVEEARVAVVGQSLEERLQRGVEEARVAVVGQSLETKNIEKKK